MILLTKTPNSEVIDGIIKGQENSGLSAKDYSAVEFDCATCGPESRPEEAFEIFEKFLKPKKVKIWYKKGIADCSKNS